MFFETVIGFIILGALLGFAHAFELDHIAAVSSISSQTSKLREAASIGAWWGAGHTITLFFFGSVVLVLGEVIPESVANNLEMLVGVLLVFLGLNIFRKIREHKLHVHTHTHDAVEHTHIHSHKASQAHNHTHVSFITGLVHGLAGTGALLLLALSLTERLSDSLLFMFSFGVGSVFGMSLLAASIGLLISFVKGYQRVVEAIQIGAGGFSVALGVFVIYTSAVT